MSDDEVGQEVGQHLRGALTIAMQMGEKFARLREELARDGQARSAAQARELSARFDAERGSARAALQVVDRPEWWERASVQDTARVAETAEAWKRDTDPAGFQDYRVQTSIDWNDAGQVSPSDPAAVAAARAALIDEWKDAIAPERARAAAELTEAQQLIAEADRLDRAGDARADAGARDVPGAADVDNGPAIQAAELEARADDYDRDAAAGGTADATPDELRELAADVRAQAQLFRDPVPPERQDATQSVNATADTPTAPAADPRASAAREAGEAGYDNLRTPAGDRCGDGIQRGPATPDRGADECRQRPCDSRELRGDIEGRHQHPSRRPAAPAVRGRAPSAGTSADSRTPHTTKAGTAPPVATGSPENRPAQGALWTTQHPSQAGYWYIGPVCWGEVCLR